MAKAFILSPSVECPACKNVLLAGKNSIRCINELCRLYKVEYHRLTVQLKRVRHA